MTKQLTKNQLDAFAIKMLKKVMLHNSSFVKEYSPYALEDLKEALKTFYPKYKVICSYKEQYVEQYIGTEEECIKYIENCLLTGLRNGDQYEIVEMW